MPVVLSKPTAERLRQLLRDKRSTQTSKPSVFRLTGQQVCMVLYAGANVGHVSELQPDGFWVEYEGDVVLADPNGVVLIPGVRYPALRYGENVDGLDIFCVISGDCCSSYAEDCCGECGQTCGYHHPWCGQEECECCEDEIVC